MAHLHTPSIYAMAYSNTQTSSQHCAINFFFCHSCHLFVLCCRCCVLSRSTENTTSKPKQKTAHSIVPPIFFVLSGPHGVQCCALCSPILCKFGTHGSKMMGKCCIQTSSATLRCLNWSWISSRVRRGVRCSSYTPSRGRCLYRGHDPGQDHLLPCCRQNTVHPHLSLDAPS